MSPTVPDPPSVALKKRLQTAGESKPRIQLSSRDRLPSRDQLPGRHETRNDEKSKTAVGFKLSNLTGLNLIKHQTKQLNDRVLPSLQKPQTVSKIDRSHYSTMDQYHSRVPPPGVFSNMIQ